MNELDTFTINFVTEGIDKLLDGMDKLNKQMDKVDTGFTKVGSKGDSFFNKFIGWGTKISGLIGGIYSIGKAITDTINSSNEILTLHKTADEVGHTAKEIEVLGLTLQRFSPNLSLTSAYGQAGSFYKALNDLRLDEARLSPNSSFMKELNMARTSAILATDSDQDIVRKLRVGVQNYLRTQSPEMASASIERLLSAAGISYKDFGGLFKASDSDFNRIMQEMNNKAWRYDPKYQQDAQNLAEARLNLSETWKKMTDEMMPMVTKLIQDFTKLLEMMKPIINAVVMALDWVVNKFGWVLDKIGQWWKGQQEKYNDMDDPANVVRRFVLNGGKDANGNLLDMDVVRKAIASEQEEQKGWNWFQRNTNIRGTYLDMALKKLDGIDNSANALNGINSTKTIKVESITNQTFNGYNKDEVGSMAKMGAEQGAEQGMYPILHGDIG